MAATKSKKPVKPVKGDPANHKPAWDPNKTQERTLQSLDRIAVALEEIAKMLEMLEEITKMVAVLTGPPVTTSDERAGSGPRFISGGFRRRAGDIYGRVAEPGSPNAGDRDDDNSSGSI
jgi:hypothetical protein